MRLDVPRRWGPATRRWAVVAGVVAFAAAATPPEPWSTHSRVATWGVVAAMAVLALAWGRHRPAEPPATTGPVPASRRRGYAVWAVLFVGTFVHQMSMFYEWPRDVYPTLSSLFNILLGPRPVQIAAFAAWILFGVFIVRRVPVGDHADGPPSWRGDGSRPRAASRTGHHAREVDR